MRLSSCPILLCSHYFARDPVTLASWALTADERELLLSGDRIGLRSRARSVVTDDPTQQFNRNGNPQLIEIDPVVHLDLQANDNITATGPGMLFVNEYGTIFRAEAKMD